MAIVGEGTPRGGQVQRVDRRHIWIDRETNRPEINVQSGGLWIYGDHKHWGGGDEICYYRPAHVVDIPKPIWLNERIRSASYLLVDLFESGGLWDHRYDGRVLGQRSDGRGGFMALDKLTTGKPMVTAADPPWSWNDRNDTAPIEEMATDPAHSCGGTRRGWVRWWGVR